LQIRCRSKRAILDGLGVEPALGRPAGPLGCAFACRLVAEASESSVDPAPARVTRSAPAGAPTLADSLQKQARYPRWARRRARVGTLCRLPSSPFRLQIRCRSKPSSVDPAPARLLGRPLRGPNACRFVAEASVASSLGSASSQRWGALPAPLGCAFACRLVAEASHPRLTRRWPGYPVGPRRCANVADSLQKQAPHPRWARRRALGSSAGLFVNNRPRHPVARAGATLRFDLCGRVLKLLLPYMFF
jgi:hypothetical protein